MGDKEVVSGKVERYLKEIFPSAQKKSEGQFTVPFESTRIWVSVEDGHIPKSEKNKAKVIISSVIFSFIVLPPFL